MYILGEADSLILTSKLYTHSLVQQQYIMKRLPNDVIFTIIILFQFNINNILIGLAYHSSIIILNEVTSFASSWVFWFGLQKQLKNGKLTVFWHL